VYERILVPLDGSELAGRLRAEVRVVCVEEIADDQYRHMRQCHMQRMAEDTKLGKR